MSLGLLPGIRFDRREPLPPRFAHFALGPGGQQGTAKEDHVHPWGHNNSHVQLPTPPKLQATSSARGHVYGELPVQNGFLPPLSSSVEVQIVHDTAKFTVTHLFWNQSSHIEQGVYQILLPFDASVTGFSCQIGQVKIVRGRVEAKEDARREFDNAVRRGRAGGLVEQQAADIFRISLANIPANTKMRAKLSFMSLLKHSISNDREVFTLNVPAYIAPRYGEIPWGVQAVPPEQHFFSHRFLNLEIDLLTAEDLLSVDSPTHNIVVRRGGGQKACQTWDDFVMRKEIDTPNLRTASVQLEQGQASLDKDMVVNITTAISDHGASPHACLETHPTIDNHQALMLTLPSDYLATTESIVHDGEIIFVADRSGSMRPKIEYLKSALMFFIDGVPQNRPFNIWCFGNDCVGMWPRSKPLNEKTKQDAISYVHREFAADMGGTDLLPALMSICEARGGHTTTDLVVLTDGDVLEPEATISFVKQKRLVSDCTFRCFALGIGNFVSHELIEGMAGAGGGYAEVIASTIYGGWEDRVVAVLKAMLTSHASSICMELVWQTGSTLPPKLKQSPPHISSISPFLRNRIFILVDSGQHVPELEAVVLKIRGPDNDLTTKTVLPKRLLLPDDTIHKLAARALLGDLERGESWLHVDWQQGGDAEPPVRDEAISLGRQWSLVSRWTSLCAIEEHTFGVVDDIVLPEDTDNIEDALLQPRGVPSANNAGLLNVAQAADSAGESDLSDVESITDHNMQQDYTKDREDGSDRVNKSLNTALCSEPGNLYGGYHVIVRSPSDVAKQAEASPNLAHDWESMPSRKRSDLAGLSITNGHRPCSTFQMRGPRSRRVKRGLGSRSTEARPRERPVHQSSSIPANYCSSFPTQGSAPRGAAMPNFSYEQPLEYDASPLERSFGHPLSIYDYMENTSLVGQLGYRMSVPVYNPPASTCIVQNETTESKSTEDLAAERLVSDLLVFHKSDGSFAFNSNEEIEMMLGPSFLQVAAELRTKLPVRDLGEAVAKPRGTLPDTIVTVVVVALLEEQFQACKALWVLMVRKARAYLLGHLLSGTVEELVWRARQHLANFASIAREMKDASVMKGAVDILQSAPTY